MSTMPVGQDAQAAAFRQWERNRFFSGPDAWETRAAGWPETQARLREENGVGRWPIDRPCTAQTKAGAPCRSMALPFEPAQVCHSHADAVERARSVQGRWTYWAVVLLSYGRRSGEALPPCPLIGLGSPDTAGSQLGGPPVSSDRLAPTGRRPAPAGR